MISVWSLFSSTLWFLLAFLLLFLLRGHTDFLMRHGTTAWSMAVVLTLVRLLLPLDVSYMVILRSYTVLPKLRFFLELEPVSGISIGLILIGCWVGGALIWLAYFVYAILRDRKHLQSLPRLPQSPQVRSAASACDINEARIHVTSEVSIPMSIGLIHPVIYLPDTEYSEADLIWILKHEMTHIAGHDAWLKLGFLVFRCLFWWNPLVHMAQKSVDDILELRCDKSVLEGLDAMERTDYAQALCHVSCQAHQSTPFFVVAGTFVQPNEVSTLALRVKVALDNPRPHAVGALVAFLLSFALFAASYIFILQPAEFPPDIADGVEIYKISPETSYLKRTPSGDYEVWCNGEFAGPVRADELDDEVYKDLEVRP